MTLLTMLKPINIFISTFLGYKWRWRRLRTNGWWEATDFYSWRFKSNLFLNLKNKRVIFHKIVLISCQKLFNQSLISSWEKALFVIHLISLNIGLVSDGWELMSSVFTLLWSSTDFFFIWWNVNLIHISGQAFLVYHSPSAELV